MASEMPETQGKPGCYVLQGLAMEPLNAQGSRPVGEEVLKDLDAESPALQSGCYSHETAVAERDLRSHLAS